MNSIFNKSRIKSNGKQMKISFKTVNNQFNEVFEKPKIIRKVFFLSEENKKQRITFCKNILLILEKNDFVYGQTHLFYKEDMEEIKERNNANLILEQEGAS